MYSPAAARALERSSEFQRYETLDHVIPYQRRKVCLSKALDKAKFVYQEEVTYTKTIRRPDAQGNDVETEESITTERERKRELLVYGMKVDEDVEHFFEAFERLQQELRKDWNRIRGARANDADLLFRAMETMLQGLALTEWKDVIAAYPTQPAPRNWEDYKAMVATYITKKVVGYEDAYRRQRQYLQQRQLPKGMAVADWWKRLQTMNRWLPYLFKDLDDFHRWHPAETFPNWWVSGQLPDAELRVIVEKKVPVSWQQRLNEVDIGHQWRNQGSIDEVIDWYKKVQTGEQNHPRAGVRGGMRRGDHRGRGQNYRRESQNYYNNNRREGREYQQRGGFYYNNDRREGMQ